MSGDLLASVEAAAGLAVYGGSRAAVRGELVADGIPGLLASKDPTLWGTAAEAHAKSRLGWVDAYRRSRELLPQIAELCEELADLTDVVVCGPAAAANAITRTLGVPLKDLDTTDPERTVAVLTGPSAGADRLRQAYRDAGVTEAEAGRHFVVVAPPDSPLSAAGQLAVPADPDVTGAWGALTATALVPAALAGVDVAELLDEAELLAPSLPRETDNPALALGVALATAEGTVALRSDGTGFEGFGEWVAELLTGLLPVVVEGAGAVTVSYGGGLPPASVPGGGVRPDVAVNGPLGAQFLAWQFATAIAARVRGVDPFGVN
jgi:glucose-6-phosphate isomerase